MQEQISRVGTINPSSNLPKTIKYVDLESVKGTTLVSYQQLDKKNAPSRAQRLAHKGDIFYQTVRPYQKNNYFFDKVDENFVFSTGYAQIRPNEVDGSYLFYKLQDDRFVNEVLRRCTGTSYPAINSTDLSTIKFNLPKSLLEQECIGKVFKKIDEIITLEQEKLTQYICFKNALLQNMFPKRLQTRPKLRFKEFNDNWVNIRLGDIATLKNGYSFKSNSYESIGKYKIITISNVKGDLTVDTTEVKKINRLPKKIQPHQILNVGDILISMTGNVGRVSIIDEENTLLNQRVGVLVPKSIDFDINFILSILQTPKFEQSMINQGQGAAQLNISKKDIENFQFMIPSSSKERKLIGEEIASINRIILSLNSNIKFYKNLKKILLNNLFI